MRSPTKTIAWLRVHCTLPTAPKQADLFLTQMLGPLMNAMVEAAELRSWYFERCQRQAVCVHAQDADQAVVLARLAGLGYATAQAFRDPGAGAAPRVVARPAPAEGELAARDRQLLFRSTQLAMEVIASTPTRSARLRAAFDLAVAAVIGLDLVSVTALARLGGWAYAGDTMAHLSCPRGAAADGWSPACHGPRWRRIADAVRAGHGPVAGWGRCLAEAGAPAAEAASALHVMLAGQLGLPVDDEWRIYGSLVTSLRASVPYPHRGGAGGSASCRPRSVMMRDCDVSRRSKG